MSGQPAWFDVKFPVKFVPTDVQESGKADFDNMPSGSIGRAYIPSTAAATWEVYYPDGLLKKFNTVQDYGAPMQNVMEIVIALSGKRF